MRFYIRIITVLYLISYQSFLTAQTPVDLITQYNQVALSSSAFRPNSYLNSLLNTADYHNYEAGLGDRVYNILSSYLTLYKTTGDKAYLHKFISTTFLVQNYRNDADLIINAGQFNNFDATHHPGWCNNVNAASNQMYHDGNAIGAMAEYCLDILKHDAFIAIAGEALPACTDLEIADCSTEWPGTATLGAYPYTYGGYASWLADRIAETLDWYIDEDYWDDNVTFKQYPANVNGLQINQVAMYGNALFYVGAFYSGTSNNTKAQDYLLKAKKIALRYKGQSVVFNYDNNLNFPCTPAFADVLNIYDTNTDAYVWYTNGWETHAELGNTYCPQNVSGVATAYWEDISHGSVVVNFPLAVYEYQQEYWGTSIFDATDMQRFANTLTRLLYHTNINNEPDFYYSVNTGDANCYICPVGGGDPSEVTPHEENRRAALGYAPLHNYDATTGSQNVYNILMSYYTQTLDNDPSNIEEGSHYSGLAYLTQLQWQMECVNLNLYNRKVVYDQDFWAKNKLSIDPPSAASNPYAEPNVTAINNFTIENGVTSNIYAGEDIEFTGEVEFKAGSEVHVYIDAALATACQNGARMANNALPAYSILNSETYKNRKETIRKENSSSDIATGVKQGESGKFNIVPNPNNGFFSIHTAGTATVAISVANLLGEMVYRTQSAGGNTNIDLSGQSKGIYFVTMRGEGINETKKVIIE